MRWPAVLITVALLLPSAARSDDTAPTAEPAAEPVADGPALYAKLCSKCHGDDGAGKKLGQERGKKMPDFSSAAWQAKTKDADIRKIIEFGGPPKMKMTKKQFKVEFEGQIVAIVNYVRSLNKAAPTSEPQAASAN